MGTHMTRSGHLAKVHGSMAVILPVMLIHCRPLLQKPESPSVRLYAVILASVSAEQSWKALAPMVVLPVGKVTSASASQP